MGLAERLNRSPQICTDALACPFCGSPAEEQFWHGGRPSKRLISCSSVECHVSPSVTGETRSEAIERWNERR